MRESSPSRFERTLVLAGVALAMSALLITVLPRFGQVVADGRFEHLFNTPQFLKLGFGAWDDSRGVGGPNSYYSPVVGLVQLFLARVGFNEWVIGRLVLAAYLSVAGIGAMYLAKEIFTNGTKSFIATGFLYAFNPFVSQNLLPSGLFLPYAVLPSIILFALRGTKSEPSWRHPGLVSLILFCFGALNTASVLYTLLSVGAFLLAATYFESVSTIRRLLGFVIRTMTLAVPSCALALYVLFASRGLISSNLSSTESYQTVSRTTSPIEGLRGMGNWLSYFSFGGSQEKPAPALVSSRIWFSVSLVTPIVSLIALATRNIRWRRTFTVCIVLSIVVFGSAYGANATPISSIFSRIFESVKPARAFRASVKALPLAMLCISLVVPRIALDSEDRPNNRHQSHSGRRQSMTNLFTALPTLCVVLSVLPLVTFGPFAPGRSFSRIPDYWRQAFDYFDDKSSEDRVLVLPGLSRTDYEWGFVNDNMFDALMKPQVLQSQTLTTTTPELARTVREIDRMIVEGNLKGSDIDDLISVLHVDYVLVQRDVRLEEARRIDLADAESLRLVAEFGESEESPSIQVYKSSGQGGIAVATAEPPVVVSGGSGSLLALARSRVFARPVVLENPTNEFLIDTVLDRGSEVVIADGEQRRVVVSSQRTSYSPVLTENEVPSRPLSVSNPSNPRSTTLRVSRTLAEIDDGNRGARFRVPTSMIEHLTSRMNPTSFVFGEFPDDQELDPLRRQFESPRPQQFSVSGFVRIKDGANIVEGDCRPLFNLDQGAVTVRIAADAESNGLHAFVGCEVLNASAGAHEFSELQPEGVEIVSIGLFDTKSSLDKNVRIDSVPIEKRESTSFVVGVEPEREFYFTSVPFHRDWKLSEVWETRKFSSMGYLAFMVDGRADSPLIMSYPKTSPLIMSYPKTMLNLATLFTVMGLVASFVAIVFGKPRRNSHVA
jgi:hypothetical protein